MCGLAAFASRRMQSSHHSHAPEQQLSAFLTLMGLTPLPGAQQQQQQPGVAAGAPTGTASAGAQSDKAGGKTPTGARNIGTLRRQLATDPYIEWWSLQFDPAAESRAHDQLSSLTYMPVMLQVGVKITATCTPLLLNFHACIWADGSGINKKYRRNVTALTACILLFVFSSCRSAGGGSAPQLLPRRGPAPAVCCTVSPAVKRP